MPEYQVRMVRATHRMHSCFPRETPVYTYNGIYPGPTLQVQRLHPVRVNYSNEIEPANVHLLGTQVNQRQHGGESFRPAVRNVVHLHGGDTPAQFDGNPDSWFAPFLSTVGPLFPGTTRFYYPNTQPAATLFYHDYAMGQTAENIYSGLSAFYLIHDPVIDALLPSGPAHDVPLMIQDRSFFSNATLRYDPMPMTDASPPFLGETIVVNGRIWPIMNVQPTRYRLRLLNNCQGRTLVLRYAELNMQGTAEVRNLTVQQIGTDDGLFVHSVPVESIMLGVAERAEIIVDFSAFAGRRINLRNDMLENMDKTTDVTYVMQFHVASTTAGTDGSHVTASRSSEDPNLTRINLPRDPLVDRFVPPSLNGVPQRYLTLNQVANDFVNGTVLLLQGIISRNGTAEPLRWGDGITERPRHNSSEIWTMINLTDGDHPMHIHLVKFRVLDRQPIDVMALEQQGRLVFTGPPIPAEPNERAGLKDTVMVPVGTATRVVMTFTRLGEYVWLEEHNAMEMMRRFLVVVEGQYPLV